MKPYASNLFIKDSFRKLTTFLTYFPNVVVDYVDTMYFLITTDIHY